MRNICTEDGCTDFVKGHGLCPKHYWRVKKSGGAFNKATPLSRLEGGFTKTEGCWQWERATRGGGYGVIEIDGKPTPAHRASYLLYVGAIPNGMHVCHKCDNRSCVNPSHLFLGTAAENSADMVAKMRSKKGEKHPNAKLTESSVLRIKEMLAAGLSQSLIGKQYGVTSAAINQIHRGKTWGWL